ncbi:hypothetical protein B0H34DRAFT_796527 [Crassisporium funariophilum]|nr:hypothetical protein B0H34DRAFT_796527 [Crassisporium funariophilum]
MSSFISLLALLAVASAAPAEIGARLTTPISTISPVITLCTGLPVPAQGCANFAIISDACVDFTGGKSVLNHDLTGVKVPLGFICTLFRDFGCNDSPGNEVILTGGTYNLEQGVTNGGGGPPVAFDNAASSFSCSTLD